MKKYNTLVLADNKESIIVLDKILLKYCPFIELVSETCDVNDAIMQYTITKPEIILLDIDKEDSDIINFIDNIGEVSSEIIFISGHMEFGVKAVNCGATGFVVKPIEAKILQKKINRAVFNIENKHRDYHNYSYPSHIAIPSIDKIELIPNDTLLYLEAEGKYTIFHIRNNIEKIASKNLGEYEKILDPNVFFRIHHRYLINVNLISKIHKKDGSYCELINGELLPIAKRRQELFSKFLKLK